MLRQNRVSNACFQRNLFSRKTRISIRDHVESEASEKRNFPRMRERTHQRQRLHGVNVKEGHTVAGDLVAGVRP